MARIEKHVKDLKSEHWNVRSDAAIELGNIGDPAAVPHLVVALDDTYGSVQGDVARALGRIGDPAAVPHLIETFEKSGRFKSGKNVAASIADVLGDMKHPDAIPALGKALKENEFLDVQTSSAEALGNIGHPDAIPHLVRALESPRYGVMESVSEALVKFGDKVLQPLINAHKEAADEETRNIIEETLEKIQEEDNA